MPARAPEVLTLSALKFMICSLTPNHPEIGQPGLFMSLIDDINRDFPFQVTLSLDDELLGVLDWLDARLGGWDMYVDLRDQTIRYCFRDLADATAFSRRFVKVRQVG
jgi:hypothetical protein